MIVFIVLQGESGVNGVDVLSSWGGRGGREGLKVGKVEKLGRSKSWFAAKTEIGFRPPARAPSLGRHAPFKQGGGGKNFFPFVS